MGDGTLRAVLAVSSINFALKSEDEQRALVSAYVQFLNALDYQLQIVVHSRKLDIKPYLTKLQTLEGQQENELLKAQMADYRSFIAELVQLGEIMTKSFYVVIPYSPFTDKKKSFYARSKELFSPARLVQIKESKFQEYHRELMQRIGHVQGALNSIGLQSALLNTQALIELFYQLYNPVTAPNEPLQEMERYDVER